MCHSPAGRAEREVDGSEVTQKLSFSEPNGTILNDTYVASLPPMSQVARGNPRFLNVNIAGELKTSLPSAPSPLIAIPSLTLLEAMDGGVLFPVFS